jgi:hypothetical protein
MGCGIESSKKIKINYNTLYINSYSTINTKISNPPYRNKINRLSSKIWLRILNYLQYKELKEVGKINRKLNFISKDNRILIKFFQKQEEEDNTIYSFENENSTQVLDNFDKSSVQKVIDGLINTY